MVAEEYAHGVRQRKLRISPKTVVTASSPQLARRVCGSLRKWTSIGIDAWHPKHWSWLSDAGLNCLLDVLLLCEMLRKWPPAYSILLHVDPQERRGKQTH